ncbi:hypothetical protein KM043_007569 [Ampulex compressa]|nr:hypothetical protein KM043_007569 [Ampulex compressa]
MPSNLRESFSRESSESKKANFAKYPNFWPALYTRRLAYVRNGASEYGTRTDPLFPRLSAKSAEALQFRCWGFNSGFMAGRFWPISRPNLRIAKARRPMSAALPAPSGSSPTEIRAAIIRQIFAPHLVVVKDGDGHGRIYARSWT